MSEDTDIEMIAMRVRQDPGTCRSLAGSPYPRCSAGSAVGIVYPPSAAVPVGEVIGVVKHD
jgi:hypothetical protein